MLKNSKGFTLVEILIVVAIIAILALAIIPNYVGFDVDARVVTTKSNLSTIRNRISLYRAKEGKYPESLGNLLKETYSDAGIEKPYLKAMPGELISDKSGNSTYQDQLSTKSLSHLGGWVYFTDKADVVINYGKPLDKSWEDYKDQAPSEW
jgi:prepilin-type N-terminal cleavage/methylation domain-containing protein